jgi:hypothetical protein
MLSQKRRSLAPSLWMLAVGFVALLFAWRFLLNGDLYQTSTLNTSFTRLSSTEVKITISEPGKLSFTAGPSSFLDGATVFAVTIDMGAATATNPAPFTLGSTAFTQIVNRVNPDDAQEMMLAFAFPEGAFDTDELIIAELPFSTSLSGQFEIKSMYFGSLPTTFFPPFQDYPVFIESSNFLYDELGAAKILTTAAPVPTPNTSGACADTLDNDGDSQIDYPADPGCDAIGDNDEADSAVLIKPVRLNIASQFIRTVQAPDGKTETIVILPPAQEQLAYEFTLNANGGGGSYTYGIRGRNANANGIYPLENSGLSLSSAGVLTGAPEALIAANYRYPMLVTDGNQTFNFTLQIAVHDAFGDPIGLDIETNFSGEHRCVVNQVCEGFFRALNGIEPYVYGFSGEKPPGLSSLLQVNAGQAFYRFTPTINQVGSYQMTVSVRDSSTKTKSSSSPVIGRIATVNPAPTTSDAEAATDDTSADNSTSSDVPSESNSEEGDAGVTAPATSNELELTSTSNTAEISFTLVISAPAVSGTFRYAADCNFLDLSDVDDAFPYFQFTCQHGIMQGSEGLVRAEDSLNRAEAAKVTTLIFSDEAAVATTFKPFQSIAPGTSVNYQDVSAGDWYAPFVYFLFKQGVIVDNALYRPSDTLNAAEAMKLVIEAYAGLSDDLISEILDITDYNEWFQPYQTIASYVDASIAFIEPGLPAERGQIAELIYKLSKAYPVKKFQ